MSCSAATSSVGVVTFFAVAGPQPQRHLRSAAHARPRRRGHGIGGEHFIPDGLHRPRIEMIGARFLGVPKGEKFSPALRVECRLRRGQRWILDSRGAVVELYRLPGDGRHRGAHLDSVIARENLRRVRGAHRNRQERKQREPLEPGYGAGERRGSRHEAFSRRSIRHRPSPRLRPVSRSFHRAVAR